MKPSHRRLLGQAGLLLIGAATASQLAELLVGGPIQLVAAFPEYPVACSLIALLFAGAVVLCWLGSRLEARRLLSLPCRFLLLLVALGAGLIAMELLVLGGIEAMVGQSLEDYAPLIGALALAALAAAGIKQALRARLRYWIVFGASLAVFILVAVGSQGPIFLG